MHQPALGDTLVSGLDQRHGFQVITATDFRLSGSLKSDQELRHGADKRIRKPTLIPGWTFKIGLAFGGISQCGRSRVRILAPADVSDGQTVQAFDPPTDVDVARATFFCRTCPGVVDSDTTKSGSIFEDVCGDAILMRKFRAWIAAHTAED